MTSSPNRNRVSGETGSDQNQLRGELYPEAVTRCKNAMESGYYFETIVLCDSMISDRIEALLQTLLHNDPNQTVKVESIGAGIQKLDKEIENRQPKPIEYDQLSSRITKWKDDRNESIHGFAKVTNESLKSDVDNRIEKARVTAEKGMELYQDWRNFTRREINRIKSNQDT